MAKKCDDSFLDGALNILKVGVTGKGPCNKMVVCSTEPSSYSDANTPIGSGGKAIADVAMSGSDFTLANGDTNGRKVTVAAKSSILIDDSGTPAHIALLDTVNSVLLYVTTCSGGELTANGSNTVSVPVWDIEIADPS